MINSTLFPPRRFTSILMSGRIRTSSQASSELSTDSFTAVIMALCNESKPRKCLFFSKNSLIAICFCFPVDGFFSLIRNPPPGPPNTRMAWGPLVVCRSGRS